ncbi:MAG TPA: hypothetical protein VME21_13515, partial [Steroidobacteraceae bacterium]|nr:hypothetical protein [Steroidobacteraceae bacterium]
ESFCKTTGGKGLHVVTPLAPDERMDWATAKGFARTLCAVLAADAPDHYVMTMAKKARTGRIFLDYLRNDEFASAVAPLSPRARAGAPVSMPLNWAQVRAGLEPQRFNLRSAAQQLARSRPWSDYDRAAGSLADAVRRLTGAQPTGARPEGKRAARGRTRVRAAAPRS